jgi:outer membrane protein OmpA-like peptidoglycan-associated protein
MGMIARSKRGSVAMLASVMLALVPLCTANLAVAQSASPQSSAFNQNVKEVYFPFNIYNKVVNPEVLDADAAWLKQNPDTKMWLQGYADPRGDIVYNLVLSYRRAQFVKAQFVKRGVDESRIVYATGWGKLYQTCAQSDDQCFQQNRRVDTVTPESMMFHFAQ